MDLVEVVLRAVEAERYIDTFKRYNINSDCLKLLGEDDLEIMGIDDIVTRKRLIEHCQALIIKTPGKESLIINNDYIKEVLEGVNKQLHFHYNNLVLSTYRDDVILYNVPLSDSSLALRNCVNNIKKDGVCLKKKVIPSKKAKKRKIVLVSILSMGLLLGLIIKIAHNKD
ncbi:uncharacterized protein [Onthophagus taurus]|uniref:uncharacterized protein n=1 Tax=Onthophagus taurus TaxID=166361 RepID=UPI000C203025|nr:uncharacterized protein LOC111428662 [Onthophagus taurus]